MVYHNFAILTKFEVKILKNLSHYRVTTVTRFFQNFEVDIKITKITKITKIALITKILKKILKTPPGLSCDFKKQNCTNISNFKLGSWKFNFWKIESGGTDLHAELFWFALHFFDLANFCSSNFVVNKFEFLIFSKQIAETSTKLKIQNWKIGVNTFGCAAARPRGGGLVSSKLPPRSTKNKFGHTNFDFLVVKFAIGEIFSHHPLFWDRPGEPRTHKNCDIKNFLNKIWENLVILVIFVILISTSKFWKNLVTVVTL